MSNSHNRNEAIESCVKEFCDALKSAGAVDGVLAQSKETKPLYYRGIVPKSGAKKEIFIRYSVTDNLTNTAADNAVLVHDIYIDFVIYTRKSLVDKKFEKFVNKLDNELHSRKFFLDYGAELFYTDEDTEIVVSGKPITVNKLILLKEKENGENH